MKTQIKKILIITIMLFSSFFIFMEESFCETPAENEYGIGLMVGEPTAVTGKYFINKNSALDAGLGLSILNNGIWLHSDYIYQLWDVFDTTQDLPVYFGAGAVLHNREIKNDNKDKESKLDFGPRVLVGVEFHPEKYRFSFFGEVALNFFILHEIEIAPGLALGVRYYFQ